MGQCVARDNNRELLSGAVSGKFVFKDEGRLQKAISPGNLTFYCVKYN